MKKWGTLLLLSAVTGLAAEAAGRFAERKLLYQDRSRSADLKARAQKKEYAIASQWNQTPLPAEWRRQHRIRNWSVRSFDGIALSAEEYPASEDTHRWAVVVHGYRGCAAGMIRYIRMFHDLGFHVLAPDCRGHGKSGGTLAGMGGRDHLDLLQWIDEIIMRDPLAKIVLHGESMGAATVMMAVGETLPPQVCCAIEDCGYSNAEDAVAYVWSTRKRYPCATALLWCLRRRCLQKGNPPLYKICPEKQLKQCRIPMLFIHGQEDTIVPLYMGAKVYAGHPGKKQLWTVPGADHTGSYGVNPEIYQNRVRSFLSEVLPELR